MIGLCAIYLLATEYITAKKSKGEVLLFRRGHTPAALKEQKGSDEEIPAGRVAGAENNGADLTGIITKQTAIFHWEDVCYDIKIKKEERRILDHVDGWVKPGTLTALMVCSVQTSDKPFLTRIRVFLVLVKPLYSMFSLLEPQWVLLLVACS